MMRNWQQSTLRQRWMFGELRLPQRHPPRRTLSSSSAAKRLSELLTQTQAEMHQRMSQPQTRYMMKGFSQELIEIKSMLDADWRIHYHQPSFGHTKMVRECENGAIVEVTFCLQSVLQGDIPLNQFDKIDDIDVDQVMSHDPTRFFKTPMQVKVIRDDKILNFRYWSNDGDLKLHDFGLTTTTTTSSAGGENRYHHHYDSRSFAKLPKYARVVAQKFVERNCGLDRDLGVFVNKYNAFLDRQKKMNMWTEMKQLL
jgi:hypothetical protein